MEPWICDTRPSTRFTLYTRSNVGEVFPDPVMPFTRSLTLFDGAELGWRDAWVRIGAFDLDEFRDDEMDVLGVSGGYCYLNASIIRLFGERAPGLSAQAMDEQFFGAQPGIPPYAEQPGDVRPDLSEKVGGWLMGILTATDEPGLKNDQAVTKKMRATRPDFSKMTNKELIARTRDLYANEFRHYFAQHIHTTYAATVPVGVLQQLTATIGRPDLFFPLISGLGDVDSAAPSQAMWELGRLVRSSAPVSAAFDMGNEGLYERLERSADAGTDCETFVQKFHELLYQYGSRGPNEWDTAMPTWETHPELALAAIDRMRHADDAQDPSASNAKRAAEREAAANEVRAALAGNAEALGTFELALKSSSVYLPGRERSKTNAVRFIQETRLPMREFGRRMKDQGHFESIEDFSMLFSGELEDFMQNPSAFADTITKRKAHWRELSDHDPQFIFDGEPDFPGAWVPRAGVVYDQLRAGDTIQGIPGCTGVAEGRARVIMNSGDPTALNAGDILVAPATDPSWTPLFVSAGGVIVDVGAPLSHAIIVSRELGIPCVTSATGATKRIPDGAMVRVDGNTGTVTILSL
jgi:rifampicin phosphotransferase